jgi:hypothetical protein
VGLLKNDTEATQVKVVFWNEKTETLESVEHVEQISMEYKKINGRLTRVWSCVTTTEQRSFKQKDYKIERIEED